MYPSISIIIITYNRVDIFKKSLQSAIVSLGNNDSEIVIIDNSNKEIQKRNLNLINNLKCEFNKEINYLPQNKNLGVAGGRNLGIKNSKNSKCLFIDDDAYIIEQTNIEKEIHNIFVKSNKIAIIALKSVNSKFKPNRHEIPVSIRRSNREQYSQIYIGCGHCIDKDKIPLVKEKGSENLYFTDSLYGGEELDLSFRIAIHNLKIVYTPRIILVHEEEHKGRLIDQEVERIKATITIYSRYLNKTICIIHSICFMIKLCINTKSIKYIKNIIGYFPTKGIRYSKKFKFLQYLNYLLRGVIIKYL